MPTPKPLRSDALIMTSDAKQPVKHLSLSHFTIEGL